MYDAHFLDADIAVTLLTSVVVGSRRRRRRRRENTRCIPDLARWYATVCICSLRRTRASHHDARRKVSEHLGQEKTSSELHGVIRPCILGRLQRGKKFHNVALLRNHHYVDYDHYYVTTTITITTT